MSESSTLHVLLNNEAVLQFDRDKTLPEEQRQYLDNMDIRMDEGVSDQDEMVKSLNPLQKAQFVANSMINGLLKDDFNQAMAMCTYLGDRIPNLKQVICNNNEGEEGMQIEFVYDQDYEKPAEAPKEQTIKFFNPKDFVKH